MSIEWVEQRSSLEFGELSRSVGPVLEEILYDQLTVGSSSRAAGVEQTLHSAEPRYIVLDIALQCTQAFEEVEAEDLGRGQREQDLLIASELLAKAVIGDANRIVFSRFYCASLIGWGEWRSGSGRVCERSPAFVS